MQVSKITLPMTRQETNLEPTRHNKTDKARQDDMTTTRHNKTTRQDTTRHNKTTHQDTTRHNKTRNLYNYKLYMFHVLFYMTCFLDEITCSLMINFRKTIYMYFFLDAFLRLCFIHIPYVWISLWVTIFPSFCKQFC